MCVNGWNQSLMAVSESLKRVWNISKRNVYSLSKAEISLLSPGSTSSSWLCVVGSSVLSLLPGKSSKTFPRV